MSEHAKERLVKRYIKKKTQGKVELKFANATQIFARGRNVILTSSMTRVIRTRTKKNKPT